MKFYLPEHGQGPEDAEELPKSHWGQQIYDPSPELYAEIAAEYCQSARDGWDWIYPMEFNVIDDTGRTHEITVNREARPLFTGCKKGP